MREKKAQLLEEEADWEALWARHRSLVRTLDYTKLESLEAEIERRNAEAEWEARWARHRVLAQCRSMCTPNVENAAEELAVIGVKAPNCFEYFKRNNDDNKEVQGLT